jgi:hypothetical protein
MSQFRSEELISLTDLFFILTATAILLTIVYVLLKKIKPGVLQQLDKKFSHKIELIEKRYIPHLGQVFIISVESEQFVVVQAKTGVTLAPLKKPETVDIDQPDIKSP